jgi:hypothetical protein
MNKLKLLEAMNMIDDELIKEAELPSDTVLSEAETGENANAGLTASGVEVYHRPAWQRFTAIAAAFVLIAGLTGGGAYYFKNRSRNINDNNVIESEVIAPVTNNGDIITTDNDSTESASTVTTGTNTVKHNGTTGTASSDKNAKVTETKITEITTTGKINIASTTSAKESNINTDKTESSGAKTSKTTAKQNSGKGTTTTSPKNSNVRPTVEVPSDGKMTKNELLQFVKYYGDDMTWSDFEPYQHEYVAAGQSVWRIPVYDNGVQKYTLLVSGDVNKKPNSIYLHRGTEPTSQNRIDVRSSSDAVYDFLNSQNALAGEMMFLEDCLTNPEKNIAISNPSSSRKVYLGYSETKHLTDLIKNLDTVKDEGSEWQTSSDMSYDIYFTTAIDLNSYQLFTVQYPYVIVGGTGYKATDSSLRELSDYCKEIFDSRQNPREIDVDGVWCWYDSETYNGELCDKTDNITIKQFPDLRFDYLGKINKVAITRPDGSIFGNLDTQLDTYFADINGDGYPEYCSTYNWGLDSIVIAVKVWDMHNNYWVHILASPDEYNYDLHEENGELFVYRNSDLNAWNVPRQGEKGRLRIDGDFLVFDPVE